MGPKSPGRSASDSTMEPASRSRSLPLKNPASGSAEAVIQASAPQTKSPQASSRPSPSRGSPTRSSATRFVGFVPLHITTPIQEGNSNEERLTAERTRSLSDALADVPGPPSSERRKTSPPKLGKADSIFENEESCMSCSQACGMSRFTSRASAEQSADNGLPHSSFSVRRMLSAKAWPPGPPSRQLPRHSHSSQQSTKTVLNLSGIRRKYVGHDGKVRKSSICADGLHLDTVNVILKADKDHDGKVTQEEMLQAVSGMVTSNEFFRKLTRYLAALVVLLILAISLVVVGTTVGFKDTTVNENNTLIVYSIAGDSLPVSTGGLEAVYQVNAAENAFAQLKEPLRQRTRLVALDFADGSLVQFEPKFVQVFATTALVKNLEVGISLTLRRDELPVVEYINEQPMLYETVTPSGLTSLSAPPPSVAPVRTITLYRFKGQEQWEPSNGDDAQAGGAVVAVAPKTTAEVQAAAFVTFNVALKRGVIPEVDQPLDVRFVLKRRGMLGEAEQWVLLGVDESEVEALCGLVESAAIGGVCGHAGADGQIEVDTTGMSEEEVAELCAEETSPSLDSVCGRVSATAPYYVSVAATFGILPVTITADGRNALREWLRASVHIFNVTGLSSTVGIGPTSAWESMPHELPHSLHQHFHDSVHRALLGTRAGEAHLRRQLEQMEGDEFDRLVAVAADSERRHQTDDGDDGLQRRPRRSLLPAYFRNAVANQRVEHKTCFHWDEGHRFSGTGVTSTTNGKNCAAWEAFAKAKCPSLANFNANTIAECVCDVFDDTARPVADHVALASNYPRAPCEQHRRPMCVVKGSGSDWSLEPAALPECDSEYFAPVFRRWYSAAAAQTPVFDEWLYNLERVVKWGPNYGSFEAYPTFNFCGRGVHFFIFDTGINYLHEDFQVLGNPKRSRVVLSYNAARKQLCTGKNKKLCLDTAAGRGHGSHVAGIAAGLKYGLAQCAVIHMVKLGDDKNFKYSSVQEGIRWAIQFHNRNIKGQKNSAGRRLRSVAVASLGVAYSKPYNKQFARLAAAGIPTAVAAGNEDADACRSSPAAIGGPGKAGTGSAVMTVAATSLDDTKGVYSNYGTCVDVWAPGTAIASVNGVPKLNGQMPTTGYRIMSGTSMAAPLVGATMALVSEAYPTYTARQVKEFIVRYARANIISAVPQNLWSATVMRGLSRPGPLQYFEREWLEQIQTDVCIGGNCQSDDAHNLEGTRNLILRLPPKSADGVAFWSNGRRLSETGSGDDANDANDANASEPVEEVGACNWTIAIVGSECPEGGSYLCGQPTGELPDGTAISRPFYQLGPYCADGCYCDPASLPAYFEYATCVDASTEYIYSGEQCSPVYVVNAAEAHVIEGRSLTFTPLSGGVEVEPPLVETRPVAYELATASAPGNVTIGGKTYSMDMPSRLALYSDASAKVSLFDGDQLFNMFGEDHLAIYVNENGYVCFQDSDLTVASPTIADHFAAAKGNCFSFFLTDLTFDTVANPGSGVYVTTLYTGTSLSRRPYATAITYYQAIGDGDPSRATNTIQAFLEYYSNATRVVYSSDMSSTIQAVIGPSRGVEPAGFEAQSITELIP